MLRILEFLAYLRWQDILDILLLSILAYWLYVWFQRTRGLKVLLGLAAIGGVFAGAKVLGLFLTSSLFQILWQIALILIVVVFQPELREFFEKASPLSWFGRASTEGPSQWMEAIGEALFFLVRSGLGGLVVVERRDRVDQNISGGVFLHAETTSALLLSIFQKTSPLHDGAVVLRSGEIWKAGCYLPLALSEGLPQSWGTRHRAAVGLSERCDAIIFVVSEETGRVSVASRGKVEEVTSPEQVIQALERSFGKRERKPFVRRLTEMAFKRAGAKLVSLGVVGVIWLFVAGRQDAQVTLFLPVETRNLPEQWEIVEPLDPRVMVTIKGMRKDLVGLENSGAFVEMDLSLAKLGRRTFRIGKGDVILPTHELEVVKVEPTEIKFRFRERG
jgi:diadenylate cyclase